MRASAPRRGHERRSARSESTGPKPVAMTCVERGPGSVARVVVGRDHGPARLEHVPVANGAVADAEPAAGVHLVGRHGDSARDEHLAPPGVDHRQRAVGAGRERVERRYPGPVDPQREREPPRDGQPYPRAREAPRPRADDERIEVGGPRGRLPEQRVDVLEQRLRHRRALAQHLAVVDEGARGDVSRRVEGQDQHSKALVAACRRPRRRQPAVRSRATCSRRTRARGGGSASTPASGHSTKTIASSKYGSRSPHSAADRPRSGTDRDGRRPQPRRSGDRW